MRSVLFEKVPTAWDNTDPENPIETEWEEQQLFRNTDVVGLIVDSPAELNENGEVTSEATYVDGFHCNLRVLPGESIEGLENYALEPNSPSRVWA